MPVHPDELRAIDNLIHEAQERITDQREKSAWLPLSDKGRTLPPLAKSARAGELAKSAYQPAQSSLTSGLASHKQPRAVGAPIHSRRSQRAKGFGRRTFRPESVTGEGAEQWSYRSVKNLLNRLQDMAARCRR